MVDKNFLAAFSAGALTVAGAGLFLLRSPYFINRFVQRVIRTGPPHPNWKPGQKQPGPYAASQYLTINPSDVGCYPLVISASVPRPIAFVSSANKDGSVRNLAPYSYFNFVAHDPPHVVVGMCHSDAKQANGRLKDSLYHILQTEEFVLNIISEWFIEAANYTCGMFDYGVDEMELVGLTPVPSVKVAPARVGEAAVQCECKLRHTYEVKNSSGVATTTVVIAEVLLFHVNEAVVGKSPSGKVIVEFDKLRPMARLGGNTYGRIGSVFDLPRPDRKT